MAEGEFDALVVGAGFGGLGCALRLVELGARPLVLEALSYPGGCASTFRRAGYRFEAGATLFAGFGPRQLFRQWIERHGLAVEFQALDPLIELRAPGLELPIPSERKELLARLESLPGAPREGLRRFFAHQARVADALWHVLDRPELLPPFDWPALAAHARRLPKLLPLVRFLGRPLERCLAAYGVHDFAPLRTLVEGLCQISVQCGAAEAETALALATLDYPFRGAGHVRGGIGVLADELVAAIERGGGEVRFSTRARDARRTAGVWSVETTRGTFRAPRLALNLLPGAARTLLGEQATRPEPLARRQRAVEGGWGACMRYLVCRPPADAGPRPRHLQLVDDPAQPFVAGNAVFCSISGADERERCPPGLRTMTVSTHVPADVVRAAGDRAAALVAAIQARMRTTLERRAPEWLAAVEHEETASPRTFARFTSRPAGWVGGIPRRAGLGNYVGLAPLRPAPGVVLVGDSAFPGQSTLATALSGLRAAEILFARP